MYQQHSPTDLLSGLLSFCVNLNPQLKHGLSQCARLASFRLLCSNTSLHWLLKQVALHSMDYVSPTSCSIPFLVLLGTGIFFFLFLHSFFFFCEFFFFCLVGGGGVLNMNASSNGSVGLAFQREQKQ